MDHKTANQDVSAQIEEIKRFMPLTYAAIKAKAARSGNDVFVWVRWSLRGEPNFFYAIEGERVVGTPFTRADVSTKLAEWWKAYGPFDIVFFASEGVI